MTNRLLIAILLATLLLGSLFVSRTAQAASPTCHTVKVGQSVTMIAHLYGVSVQEIVELNRLKDPNLIYPGQCLLIPTAQPQASGCTTTYVVKSGDYLGSIAVKFRVAWQSIVAVNNLPNPDLIYIGQHLLIPVHCQPAATSRAASPASKKTASAPQPKPTSAPEPTSAPKPASGRKPSPVAQWTWSEHLVGPGQDSQVCGAGLLQIRVTVVNAAGGQIPGIWIYDRITNTYHQTGDVGSPDWGPGEAQFIYFANGAGSLCISTGPGGQCVTDSTRVMKCNQIPDFEDIWAAGYCKCCSAEAAANKDKCRQLYDAGDGCLMGPNRKGHFSWRITFRQPG